MYVTSPSVHRPAHSRIQDAPLTNQVLISFDGILAANERSDLFLVSAGDEKQQVGKRIRVLEWRDAHTTRPKKVFKRPRIRRGADITSQVSNLGVYLTAR